MKGFFKTPQTIQVMRRERVKEEDIGENYVPGSEGQIKTLEIISDNEVDRMGDQIIAKKNIMNFYYQDESNPTDYTEIETIVKEERQEVD